MVLSCNIKILGDLSGAPHGPAITLSYQITVFGPTSADVRHCAANEIEHRLTKPNHPWTNGQVERMSRLPMQDSKPAPAIPFHPSLLR
jgi:transposase InsO family protein